MVLHLMLRLVKLVFKAPGDCCRCSKHRTMSSGQSLTSHLTSLPRLRSLHERATSTHPFLSAAQNGSLSSELLGYYLGQDRIYASYAYPKYIAGLIRKIDACPEVPPGSVAQESILPLLSSSLSGVVHEVQFFDETAKKYGLVSYPPSARAGISRPPYTMRPGTRNYLSEMARVAEWNDTWQEGVVFLWAMEKVYLDAWSLVNDKLSEADSAQAASPVQQALQVLSAHWSSPSFIRFVNDLGSLVDSLYHDDKELKHSAEYIFSRVLELEAGFWPTEEELLLLQSQFAAQ
ncbi:hypothetical protein HGRIS_011395 [Hohenbuehelia grisea]|uniref:Thiaminase-2/PQQC domain-containing protein n=1 Tax=Hohenbuehelia grisea TaxID=104357 RepID=A0ABR3JWB4_9AGAR